MRVLDDDFQQLLGHLKSKGYIHKSIDASFQEKLKECHKLIYSFLVWDDNLQDRPDREKYFVSEIRSDGIMSLPLALSGYNKASAHALRSMIENVIRLVYYSHHEIEYRKMLHLQDNQNKSQITFEGLFDYLKTHPIIGKHVQHLSIVTKLQNSYRKTSSYVHASAASHMGLVKTIDTLEFNKFFFEDFYLKQLRTITAQVNGLLALHYHRRFHAYDIIVRDLIRPALTTPYNTYIMSLPPVV